MAAPIGNTNAQTHGVHRSRRLARQGIRARRLPKGFRYVASEASHYATALHADVQATVGEVGRDALESIEAAAAWHQHALYALRVLRVDHDSLKPEARVQLSGEVARAIQRRADSVKAIRLRERKPPFNGTLYVPEGTTE